MVKKYSALKVTIRYSFAVCCTIIANIVATVNRQDFKGIYREGTVTPMHGENILKIEVHALWEVR